MIYKSKMSEEQYKQAMYEYMFSPFRYEPDFGKSKIDFCLISPRDEERHLLWAEAKKDVTACEVMLTQLLFTVRKFYFTEDAMPPSYLAVFDPEKFTLYKMENFRDLLFRQDIEWSTTPSNHSHERFKQLQGLIERYVKVERVVDLRNKKDLTEFKTFIKTDLEKQSELTAFDMTVYNLNHIFDKWCDEVLPQIDLSDDDWEEWGRNGVAAADFFIADAYVDEDFGETSLETLQVQMRCGKIHRYFIKVAREGVFDDPTLNEVTFKDNGVKYEKFWKRCKRPPRREKTEGMVTSPWEDILLRRDILIPRDVMERRGAFFTPRKWVNKAHDCLREVLSDNWQDEYTIWDCATGTGNLLSGLYNSKQVFASDIDRQNVLITANETKPTFAENVFQFDFLNDEIKRKSDGGKVPDALVDVLECEERRKKLVFLINPPYAEGDGKKMSADKEGRKGIGETSIKEIHSKNLGKAQGELFAQFIARIYLEFKGCIIGEFSKLKILQSPNFEQMRTWFKPELKSCFLIPAETFDNVSGKFPIGFKVWDSSVEWELTPCIEVDAYKSDGKFLTKHQIHTYFECKLINDWKDDFLKNEPKNAIPIAKMGFVGNDFQNQSFVFLSSKGRGHHEFTVSDKQLLYSAIYFSVRHSVKATWLNDREQFCYPSKIPLRSKHFVNNCLIFAIFHNQNYVSIANGENHWIPFSEKQIGTNEAAFKHKTVYECLNERNLPEELTPDARAVYDAGLEIFRYYHTGNDGKPFPHSVCGNLQFEHNASIYDIRRHFQGVNAKGRMASKSPDTTYQALNEQLKEALNALVDKQIVPSIYEHGFLLDPVKFKKEKESEENNA
ncbi:MAG: hypothetical protein FWF76_07840 [Oscillospiraceae bacterium]|nr:hypothetical protein [Oscillospiraceae bacterium]